jgi:uncharacterized protein (TIGR00645 family)
MMGEDDQHASEAADSAGRLLELRFEAFLFGSRWLALPIYIGFVVALGLLVVKFIEETCLAVPYVLSTPARDLIVEVLRLVDLSFAVNLLIVVMFAGFQNFVSRIDLEGHDDRPGWLDQTDFAALKLKLIASIVAISAIDLLERFMDIENQKRDILVMLGCLQILFVIVGVLLAAMDRLSNQKH